MKTTALLTLAACLLPLTARADDWPQFRGPNRDGVSKETGLLKTWPKDGPNLAWTYKQAGTGYCGPAIVGERLYTCGARGADEYVFALDLTKNPPKELWAVKIGPTFMPKIGSWNQGPLVTPTVDGDLVFALGGGGDLVCVDRTTKTAKWRTHLIKDLNGNVYNFNNSQPAPAGWGFACAPLVDGDQVICVPGGKDGTLAALNKKTGEHIWRSKTLTADATYASPVMATIAGTKQYLQMTEKGVAAVDPKGALLWYYKREEPYADIVGCSPLVKGDRVLISGAGEGAGGCDLIEIKKDGAKFEANRLYAKKALENYHGGLVLVGDYVYGSVGASGPGSWMCMDFATGAVKWTSNDRRIGKGAITAADGFLICTGEATNRIVHTPADPATKLSVTESFVLPAISPLRRPSGRFWTHPVVANGKLYLRDQELLYCYEVR